MIKISELKIGDKVEYGFYKNITFIGTDEQHAIMQDRNGDTKKVYKSLFEKYAKKHD